MTPSPSRAVPPPAASAQTAPPRMLTGVDGLDAILEGGLASKRLYLVEGAPGTGKSTLGLQFLMEGVRLGEPVLYVTLSETTGELSDVAVSHGWTLDGMDVFDLAAAEAALNPERHSTLLHAWEVELGETVKLVTDEVERSKAVRVVIDSLAEMRLLAEDALRFRRQMLALKQFFAGRHATVLLLDDKTDVDAGPNLQMYSLCHGVISLQRRTLDFGPTRRRLEISKMRAAPFREGWHDYVIVHRGVQVFPRLVAADHAAPVTGELVPSGLPELDAMLGGGALRGTCVLLSGLTGTGKSSLALQYVLAAAQRGEHCAIYEFDERAGALIDRSRKKGLDLQPYITAGQVFLRQINPGELSPGEFDETLRLDVENNATRLIVIDSLCGYVMSMPQEKQLMLKLHELLCYLNQSGVTTLLISQQGGLADVTQSWLNVSHLADTIVLLNYFEAAGHVRKGLSIIKNRAGGHEDTIRELRIDGSGLRIGEILTTFQGILTGRPIYSGKGGPLLVDRPTT